MLHLKFRFLIMTFFASVVICARPSFALEDNLQKAVEIAIHGGNFQAERLKIATENMANEHSTSFQPGGDPYRRKVVFARNDYNKRLKTNVLRVRKFDTDKSPFIMKYDPNHPAADLNGYVKLPNIHKEIERADASEAQRSYEANLSIIEMSKAMMQKTIEVIK
jgi:flagellar basal-body rod protein FlgC